MTLDELKDQVDLDRRVRSVLIRANEDGSLEIDFELDEHPDWRPAPRRWRR